jgi:restriction system protein
MPKRNSLLDDLMTLPWWFNLALAAVVYFGLKFYLPTVEFQSPAFQGIGKVFPNMAGMFASIFVFTAALSAYHAWRRGELLDRQTSVKSIKAVSWKDFEYLVSEAYRRQGYSVQENTGSGADGGVDLVLGKDGKRILVQCKNWRSSKVGVSTVRELFGVVTAEGASEGIVVCSGKYTNDALDFAKGKPITLVDGAALARLIDDVQKLPQIQTTVKDTACPVCQSPMQDTNSASPFSPDMVGLHTRLFGQVPGRLLEYPGDRDTSHEGMVCFNQRAVLELRA